MSLIIVLTALLAISLLLFLFRKKFSWHKKYFPFFYFCMHKTRLGIKTMDYIAKRHSNFFHFISIPMIIICFIGMIVVSFDVVRTLYDLIFSSLNAPAVGLVLPFEFRGVFYVPLVYWLVSIIFIAVVHEFSHGVFSRLYNIRIRSSGFAFVGILFPIIPAAFVEPDEKSLFRSKRLKQLSVFSAGPFSNIIAGILLMIIYFFALIPLSNNIYDYNGVGIIDFFKGTTPAKNIGLETGEVITELDSRKINTIKDFTDFFNGKKPGDKINIETNKGVYSTILAGEKEPVLGIFVEQKKEIKQFVLAKYGVFVSVFAWLKELVYWLFFLNLGVGFFNLLPIGHLDGGRMTHVLLKKYLPHKHANRIWYGVSVVFASAIAGSILFGLMK